MRYFPFSPFYRPCVDINNNNAYVLYRIDTALRIITAIMSTIITTRRRSIIYTRSLPHTSYVENYNKMTRIASIHVRLYGKTRKWYTRLVEWKIKIWNIEDCLSSVFILFYRAKETRQRGRGFFFFNRQQLCAFQETMISNTINRALRLDEKKNLSNTSILDSYRAGAMVLRPIIKILSRYRLERVGQPSAVWQMTLKLIFPILFSAFITQGDYFIRKFDFRCFFFCPHEEPFTRTHT